MSRLRPFMARLLGSDRHFNRHHQERLAQATLRPRTGEVENIVLRPQSNFADPVGRTETTARVEVPRPMKRVGGDSATLRDGEAA